MILPEHLIRVKELLPTTLGSDAIREQYASDILRRSIFSARMESARYLARIRDVCADIAAGRISTGGARGELIRVLNDMGFRAADGGGIKNPASARRLNLIIETHKRMASSVARLASETEATLTMWPAWELRRIERRDAPRGDWDRRWRAAAEAVGYAGVARNTARMVALKSSPVWAALGDGAGGFRDALGNPYPPFAFGSGLAWMDVDAEACLRLGLDTADAEHAVKASIAPDKDALNEAVKRVGFDIAKGLQ